MDLIQGLGMGIRQTNLVINMSIYRAMCLRGAIVGWASSVPII